MAHSMPISELADSLGRSEAFIRITLRSLGIEYEKDRIQLANAVKLIHYFSGKSGEESKLVSHLEAQIHTIKKRELELSVAIEILRRERDMLNRQNVILNKQIEKSNDRADRLEEKLHDVTRSFVHIVDQRDRLVAKQLGYKSSAVEIRKNGRRILLLKNPVN